MNILMNAPFLVRGALMDAKVYNPICEFSPPEKAAFERSRWSCFKHFFGVFVFASRLKRRNGVVHIYDRNLS